MPLRKSRGSRKSRKSRRLPKPQKGALGKYTTKDSADVRRRHLIRDVNTIGYTSTMRDLNLRATLNKNSNPTASKKMRGDMAYLRRRSRK